MSRNTNTIVARFAESVSRNSDRIAVAQEAHALTYRELDGLSNGIAARLVELGLVPGSRIGIALDRTPEFVASILGVLKAGCAYVPIDPTYPHARIQLIAKDAGVGAILTDRKIDPSLFETAPPLVDVSAIAASANAPEVPIRGSDRAYIIYTSGSTGTPKGVIVTHQNVVRLFDSTDHWYGFNHSDVWTLFHSFAFDFSVWEMWGALFYGGRLVVVPYEVTRSPEEFWQLCLRERVTVLNQTPSAFSQFMRADEASAGELALRYVIFGGEALEFASLRRWFDKYGDTKPQLVNMYGITETTVHVTYRSVSKADLERGARSPIGVPIPDLQLHVLDEQLKPVQENEIGELCVSGEGVSDGYLNRPELTAEKFVSFEGRRMYRSGDLGKLLPGGDVEYIGRRDMQVKIRGHRIELGEIEAAILSAKNVHAACVVLRHREDGQPFLAAFYSASEDCSDALRESLKKQLPSHFVPARFVRVNALPLTPHGKVDRAALTSMSLPAEVAVAQLAGAGEDAESIVAGLWRETLGYSVSSLDQNFFDAGGDSIQIVQLHLALKERFPEKNLQVVDLFRQPTIRLMAAFVSGKATDSLADSVAQRAARQQAARRVRMGAQ